MIRGTVIKGGRFEGTLPESLDTVKLYDLAGGLLSAAGRKKLLKIAGSGEALRKYSKALINVQITGGDDPGGIEQIKEDLESFEKDREGFAGILKKEMPDGALAEQYLSFLDKYQNNQKLYKEKRTKQTVRTEAPLDLGGGYRLKSTVVSIKNTEVSIDAKIKRAGRETEGLGTLRIGVSRLAGDGSLEEPIDIYEKADFSFEKGEKTVRTGFDMKELMVYVMDEEEKKGSYILEKGTYIIRILGNGQEPDLPVAVVDLPESMERYRIFRSSEWQNEVWECDQSGDAPLKEDLALKIDLSLARSFRECRDAFRELQNRGLQMLLGEAGISVNSSSFAFLSRCFLYKCGFDAAFGETGEHYVMYKRSASKSKQGSMLFIWDRLYEGMTEWTWMGLKFEPSQKYDLTSVKAYEALTLSGIRAEFRLKKENILIIEAVKGSKVGGNRRVVCNYGEEDKLTVRTLDHCAECGRMRRGRKYCRDEVLQYRNTLWDGQALLDESVFEEVFAKGAGTFEQHGMMLLRNRFFKACAFNTKISEYYRENGIRTVYDMFGNEHRAKDIKLIITPDSLKLLKFDQVFSLGDDGDEKASARDLYRLWTENLEGFGVVKWDKPGETDGRYKVGYQILNTLPLSKEDMEALFEPERDFINRLWTDDDFFAERIPRSSEKGKCMARLYDYFGKDYACTADFRSYRAQIISDRKRRLKKGEIHIEGDMYVLCSMPYEMLEYSGLGLQEREETGITPLLHADEAYIRGFEPGYQITLCRYPHLSSGSVCVMKSRKAPEYDRWFNLQGEDDSTNIAVVSPWESNVMMKLGGADFDSDTALFINNSIISRAAKMLMDEKGPLAEKMGRYRPEADGLPVAQASPLLLAGGKDEMTAQNLAWLDTTLSGTSISIGELSNNIQLFNCALSEALQDGNRRPEDIEAIYECILKLSVLNEIEIDKAKHRVKINPDRERKEILDAVFPGGECGSEERILERKTVKTAYSHGLSGSSRERFYYPAFLHEIRKERGSSDMLLKGTKKHDRIWNCPADHLYALVDGLKKPKDPASCKSSAKVLTYPKRSSGGSVSRPVKEIEEILLDTLEKIRALQKNRAEADLSYEEKNRLQKLCLEKLSKRKLNPDIMACILRDTLCRKKGSSKTEEGAYWNEEMHRYRYEILGLLFMACEETGPDNAGIIEESLKELELADEK